ncbi:MULTISPECIES: glutamine-hydrolyzing carbamoyl-phosphate synthase small subunit [Myroides]|uniref:Carbamoyl phosphate synthase small chain n=1 Tax=Myroides albus TaxID=2562892 RepID=A0A6I3LFX0_9FLAO|nr:MULTISPECIES: glutamine-hydrolyzing carbamoyl-phosphate synthase small subunit [Myroides]MTG97368.1 glutamine-hydrolyzing carbamoyl-phosphate synthase small subunit [Myroides albus]MVX34335.1 glutamine-hydrolyzing carbamoyl-phosphate synthase small subunit [Myroides sp. LoEW2-1]UVD80546.1 glutamine-hydrolyzing carbamoyl-phosphate synthase small subunit [Myroides albus]
MEYNKRDEAIIVLYDGTVFYGKSVGIKGTAYGEICFNTGMTGYQEIFTDPSYYGQIMLSTTAHIGNYGVNSEEVDSDSIKIAGLVCKNFSFYHSRPNSLSDLYTYLEEHQLVAVSDVDTRALTAYIRDNGAMNAVISTDGKSIEELRALVKSIPSMDGLELASKVSTKEPYYFGDQNARFRVAALDFGIKTNILRCLSERDCFVKVFPYDSSYEELMAFKPDGIFLSNGPGDPSALGKLGVLSVVESILEGDLPVFGICLGHQLIGLSQGVNTFKMFSGHRGVNHPILNTITGRGEITSQNHGFAVIKEDVTANGNFEISHLHLNDGTVAGMRMKNKDVFSVQYHPESSPGPHDSRYLFDEFVENMSKRK